jgi:hypothetical protein
MSFIRPEVRAQVWRWRELCGGLCALVLGLFWVLVPGGLLGGIGAFVMGIGLVLVWVGAQRGRFRNAGTGPGIVQIDEGRIIYFGPLTGGTLALAEIERLTLDPSARPSHWVLARTGEPPLSIPVNAAGAEALFDAFTALPGFRTERMLAELNSRAPHPVVIWERVPLRPASLRLH